MLIAAGAGERLREEREKTGKSQTDFGKAAGVSRGTQKAYELETSSPDINYLVVLQSMGIDVHYVLTGSRVPTDPRGLSPMETSLLEAFRSLTASDQDTLTRMAAGLSAVSKAT